MDDEENVYVCQSCGYEDDPDKFGVDLDELEELLNEF